MNIQEEKVVKTKNGKKLRKVYLSVKIATDKKVMGWTIVDNKQTATWFMFETKREALGYIKDNFKNICVMVENRKGVIQYVIEIMSGKITSFSTNIKGKTKDTKNTGKALEEIFKYKEAAAVQVIEEDIEDNDENTLNEPMLKRWIVGLAIIWTAVIAISITQLIVWFT